MLEFNIAQRAFDKLLKQKKHTYCKGKLIEIEKCNTSNSSAFWEYIRKLGPSKKRDIPWSVETDGVTYTDQITVLDRWKRDFESLYHFNSDSFDDGFKESLIRDKRYIVNSSREVAGDYELNCDITKEEVRKAIQSSKNKKACGIDGVTNELLKHDSVIELLHCLFNITLQLGVIPDMWRIAIIHLIPKEAGYPQDPLKYCGLSLQCNIYKILSSIVNNHVTNFFDKMGTIRDEQNGFRKGRSCSHHIFSLCSLVRNALNCKGGQLFRCFMDFKKAFDVMDRDLLFYRLVGYGITGRMLYLIRQFYSGSANMVCINGLLTESFISKNGVRQGDNISPTCYSAFINELITELNTCGVGVKISPGEKICVLAYADDIVLIGRRAEDLQILLNKLDDWCTKWCILINTAETKVVHYRRRGMKESSYELKVGKNVIEFVNKYKYLGITLGCHMEVDVICDSLSGAGSRGLSQLINKTQSNYDLGYSTYSKLFNACVAIILDYTCGSWYTGKSTKLDIVQARAIRYFCGLPKTSPMLALDSEMGWIPGVVRRDIETLRMYNQLVKLPNTRLTYKIFQYDK